MDQESSQGPGDSQSIQGAGEDPASNELRVGEPEIATTLFGPVLCLLHVERQRFCLCRELNLFSAVSDSSVQYSCCDVMSHEVLCLCF